jgi:ABC-2 type transport system ATP-binding protein
MIEVKGLSKHFGSKVAVDDISFTVEKGEVLGFLGPNGAGKSTTMRMVTGYLPMTGGSITVGGADIVENEIEAKAKIGYLPENAPLYSDMSVEGFLRFCGEMRRVPADKLDEAVEMALDTCFLQGVRHQSVDTLSKGFRHRTCLAQSIIHDPEVLILDEPTDGLDPNQKHEVRQLIKRMGETKTIIFSTHILEEVEAACSRAIIVDRGAIVADGTPAELKSRSAAASGVMVQLSGLAASGIKQELEKLSAAAKVDEIEAKGDCLVARVRPAKGGETALKEAIFAMAVEKNLQLTEMHSVEGRLDELFRQITQRDVEG